MTLRGAAVVLAAGLLATGPAAASSLMLRAEARVHGRWITVGDVADLADVPEEQRAGVAAVRLARAPMPGAERVLEAAEVARRLSASGVNGVAVGPADAVTRVSVVMQAVPGDELVRCGRAFLEAQAARPGASVTIEDPAMTRSLAVPEGALELKASVGARKLAGLVPVTVEAWVDGERVARQMLSFRVRAIGRGLKAARALEPGEIAGAGDFVEAELDVASAPDDVLTDAAAIAGLRVLRPVSEGQWVRRAAMAQPLQVHRGKQVTLTAKIGSVVARAPAQSRDDGAAGEVITVVNLNSKRMLKARVTGPDLVEAVMP